MSVSSINNVQSLDEQNLSMDLASMKVLSFPAGKTYELITNTLIHAHPIKRGYPKNVCRLINFRANGGYIEAVYEVVDFIEGSPTDVLNSLGRFNQDVQNRLKQYIETRKATYGFASEDKYDYRFYIMTLYSYINPPYQQIPNYLTYTYMSQEQLSANIKKFDPGLLIGAVISEEDLYQIFGCQKFFGIRLNTANNAIVVVSNANGNEYEDYWDGDIFYYTGTDAGAVDGHQTLTGIGNNNGALKAVWDAPSETTLFLFIKYAPNQCTYKGVVRLAREPYQEARRSNPKQLVWKFPLQLVDVGAEKLHSDRIGVEREVLMKSEEELKQAINGRLKNPNRKKPVKRATSTTVYDRDPEISAYVKVRAHGKCDLCKKDAPFLDKYGQPYLESHHIRWLSRGGSDEPLNMVALCPNCHSKMHVLDLDEDRFFLEEAAKRYK